jgi:hypothetical protein
VVLEQELEEPGRCPGDGELSEALLQAAVGADRGHLLGGLAVVVGQIPSAANDHLVGLDVVRGQRLGAHRVRDRAQGAKGNVHERGEALVADDSIDDASERGRARRPHRMEELGLGLLALDGDKVGSELGPGLVLT